MALPLHAIDDLLAAYSQTSQSPITAAITYLASKVTPTANGRTAADVEYYQLERLQAELRSQYACKIAESRTSLNRYVDVLPYDHSRFVFAASKDHGGASQVEYINASILRNPKPNDPVQWHYIASQGPLAHTCDVFWNMVIESGATSVVMLTGLTEGNKKKCARYFANNPGHSIECVGDRQTIIATTVTCDQVATGVERRRIALDPLLQGKSVTAARTYVDHYHFHAWPDHGVPTSPSALLSLCSLIRKSTPNASYPAPVVVHCSAGIGRTGVFCVIDVIIRKLLAVSSVWKTDIDQARLREILDIEALVAALRHQRAGMVQTRDQYRFCYTALIAALERVYSQLQLGETR